MPPCETCGQDSSSNSHTHSPQVRSTTQKPRSKYSSAEYERLPETRGYIRLLRVIGSSSMNPQVECELLVHDFSRESKDEVFAQTYEALSWCWGLSKAKGYIVIRKDGKSYRKSVSPELVAALKALRHPENDRYLWVDAICIDQQNTHEKNHQVEMMADIYGRAVRVCIWLGEGDKASKTALSFIKNEVLQLQNFDELCESEQASEKWGALLDLMQRPWFSRRWVVQEIALARKAVMYCGVDQISWRKFAVAVELFVEVETATHRLSEVMKKDPKFYHVPRWFEYVSALGASLLVEATGKLFRDSKPNSQMELQNQYNSRNSSSSEQHSDPDLSDGHCDLDADSEYSYDSDNTSQSSIPSHSTSAPRIQEFTPVQPLLSLEYLVSSLSIFDATVPHDTIYALLAIAKDTTPSAGAEGKQLVLDHTKAVLEVFTEKKRYKVDYGQPFDDVCREFVQFCIEHADQTRALDIICRPWAPESHTKRDSAVARKSQKILNSAMNKRKQEDPDQATEKPLNGNHNERGRSLPGKRKAETVPLPSWIPKLSGAAYAMYSQAGIHEMKMGRKNADTLVGLPPSNQSLMRNYNAAQTKVVDRKSLKFKKRIPPAPEMKHMKHYSMYVRGFTLDTVFEVQPSSQGGAIPREWAKAAGWRNAPDSDPPDDFWRTLVADRGRDGHNPPVYYSRACKESFFKGGLSSGRVDTTDLINNERCSVVAQFCRRVQSVIWNRSLIKTNDTKRLGLASQTVQIGDKVCILYGCSVPVTLRLHTKKEGEIAMEVEEEIRHYQLAIKSRITLNRARMKAFKDKRESEMEKYEVWLEKMKKLWLDDIGMTQKLEIQGIEYKKRQSSSTFNRLSAPRKLSLTNARLSELLDGRSLSSPPEPVSTNGHPASTRLNGFAKDKINTQISTTHHSTPPQKEIRDRARTILPGWATWVVDSPTTGDVGEGKAHMKSQEQWLEEETTERRDRKNFIEWRRVKREETTEGNTPQQSTEEMTVLVMEEPKVNWHEFERFLKYGRRWKRILWMRQKFRRWHGEYLIFWKNNHEEQQRTEIWQRLRARKFYRLWLRKSKREQTMRRWKEEYGLFWWNNQKPVERRAVGDRLKERVSKRLVAALPGGSTIASLINYRVITPEADTTDPIVTESPLHSKELWYRPDAYVERLRTIIGKRYQEVKFEDERNTDLRKWDVDYLREMQGEQELENTLTERREKAHDNNKRVADNRCYYEFLGECYIHGMMDGEAMAYQNNKGLEPQLFELR